MPRVCFGIALLSAMIISIPAKADIFSAPASTPRPIHSQFGGVGLLKTRTARMAPDSTLASSVSWNDPSRSMAGNNLWLFRFRKHGRKWYL